MTRFGRDPAGDSNYDPAGETAQSTSLPVVSLSYHAATLKCRIGAMKLKFELVIDADRQAVWDAFDDSANMQRWQPTLASYTHLSGEPGQPDAKAELIYEENGRRIEMTETITERRAPDFLAGIYETRHGTTLLVNTFENAGDGRTLWTIWSNMNFRGLMKFFAIFLVKHIRSRTENDMQRFKLMIETDRASDSS